MKPLKLITEITQRVTARSQTYSALTDRLRIGSGYVTQSAKH
jgi:hypothetical protein